MYRQLYIIPVAGTQDSDSLSNDRIRVGNIFNIARQKLIINRNTNTGESTLDIKYNIDTFAKLDDAAYSSLTMQTSETTPLLIRGNTLGVWLSGKYHIEAGEKITLPAKYQQIIAEELINEGEIINNGSLIIIN